MNPIETILPAVGPLRKIAVIGSALLRTVPEDHYDVDPQTLRRAERKKLRQGRPDVAAQIGDRADLHTAMEQMRSDVGEPGFVRSNRPSATRGLGKPMTEGPSRYSPTAGHELGHVEDYGRGVDMGQRGGLFGMGGDVRTQLPSEASATQNALERLTPDQQRRFGPNLAAAYDTYDFGARVNPEGNMFMTGENMDPVDRRALGLHGALQQSAAGRAEMPEINRSAYSGMMDKAYDVDRKAGDAWVLGFGSDDRKPHPGSANSKRIRAQQSMASARASEAAISSQHLQAGPNRQAMAKTIAEMGPGDQQALRNEALRYVRSARTQFGPHVGLGAADQIRAALTDIQAAAPAPRVRPPSSSLLQAIAGAAQRGIQPAGQALGAAGSAVASGAYGAGSALAGKLKGLKLRLPFR